jgi:hypothetical protein
MMGRLEQVDIILAHVIGRKNERLDAIRQAGFAETVFQGVFEICGSNLCLTY